MNKKIAIGLSIFIAFVFLQSLPFKFSNSLETQHIFSTLAEWSGLAWFGAYGGYMIGAFELIAAIVLFTPYRALGATLAFGIMSGAIFFHVFTPLGIVMPHFDASTGEQTGNDAGVLFMMACGTWVCSMILIVMDLKNPEGLLNKLLGRSEKRLA